MGVRVYYMIEGFDPEEELNKVLEILSKDFKDKFGQDLGALTK